MIETWKPIRGYHGRYEVSDLGRVRAVRNRLAMTAKVDRYGYANVRLNCSGVQKWKKVHRLVCEAWHGPAPSPTHHAAHLDGSRDNNRPDNLVWATPGENERHKIAHGTSNLIWAGTHGRRNPNAKLSDLQIEEIKTASGSMRELGAKYGVSGATICRVKNGRASRESRNAQGPKP